MRKWLYLFSFSIFSSLAVAQSDTEPLTCTAMAGMPVLVRTSGLGELAGDINLWCFGGVPTPEGQVIPRVDIRVYLNTNITSRVLADEGMQWSEALLLVDDPSPESQLVCGSPDAPESSPGVCALLGAAGGAGVYSGAPGRPNVFQGLRTGANTVDFLGVPLDPPGAMGRVMRIVNIRVNANQLVSDPWVPSPVQALVSVTAAPEIPVTNPSAFIGFTMPELNFLVEAPPVFPQSQAQNAQLAHNSKKTGSAQFSIHVQENFGTVFRKRTEAAYVDADTSPAPASQNAPGTPTNSETGFFNPAFPAIATRGNLGAAGLADSGTRITVKFSAVPAGVSLFTDAVVNLRSGESASGVLRRVESETGPFAPAMANKYDLVPVPVDRSTGEGYAVYEVMEASAWMYEGADIPVYVAYLTHGVKKAEAGVAYVSVYLAPASSEGEASVTAPVPRFVDTSNRVEAFTIAP